MALTLNDLSKYVLGSADIIDVSHVPPEHQEASLKKIKAEIKKKFQSILDNPRLALVFRNLLRMHKKYNLEDHLYGNHADFITSFGFVFAADHEIRMVFAILNQKLNYFSDNKESEEIYLKTYRVCELMRMFSGDMLPVAQSAYYLLILFGRENTYLCIDNFIKKHCGNISFPIRKMLFYDIPIYEKDQPINVAAWQKIIMSAGLKGIELFQHSPKIEQYLTKSPKDYTEAFDAIVKLTYSRAEENFELAKLCRTYDLEDKIFNQCLGIKPKQSDKLPNIIINGATIALTENKSEMANGYYLVKLPINDPRAYVLGRITDCCQSIGGDSEKCVIDGITRENNGFYVLLKQKNKSAKNPMNDDGKIDYEHFEIQGQGYAWLSIDGNLTFDSWENLTPEMDKIIVPMLKQFGKEVTEANGSNILRVTIGSGGNTPSDFATHSKLIQSPEAMAEGYMYGDADEQYLVYSNEARIEEYQNLMMAELKAMNISVGSIQITSVLTTEKIKHLFSESALSFYREQLGESFNHFVDLSVGDSSYIDAAFVLRRLNFLTKSEWSSIFTKPNIKDITVLLNKLDVLYPQLLTNENLQIILNRPANLSDFKGVVWFIDQIKYLNPDIITDANLKILLTHSNIEDSLSPIIDLDSALVTDANFNFLMNHINNMDDLCNCLVKLHEVSPSLVNDENRQFLAKHAKKASFIEKIISIIYDEDKTLAAECDLKLFIPSDDKAISLMYDIILLLRYYSQDPIKDNLKLLLRLSGDPRAIIDIGWIIEKVAKNHCMIHALAFKTLLSHSHLMYLILSKLESYDPALMTQTTIQFLFDHIDRIIKIGYSLAQVHSTFINDVNFKKMQNLSVEGFINIAKSLCSQPHEVASPNELVNKIANPKFAPSISIFKKSESGSTQVLTAPFYQSLRHR